ncbi:MAG: DUF1707 domain-containing protein [Actinomycetota bacterium]|nr:DUF1707 domain-containing protein [Actinomycetota bacterium]
MSEESLRSGSGGRALRASDADREQLITELNGHTVAGRLSTDELEERLRAAYAARTTGELEDLRRDLPATPERRDAASRARRAQLTRRLIQETGGAAGLFVLCVVIWAASGAHHGQFWPGWVLIVVALSLVRSAWALYGPAPDLDAVEGQLDARRDSRGHRAERRSRRQRR